MKKLFLGFATMLSLLALVLGLCACGGDDQSDGGDESSKGASYSIQAPQTSDVFNVTGLPDSAYEGDTVTFRVVLAHPADSVLNYVEVCGTDMGSRRLDAVADGSYSFIMPAEPVQLTVDALRVLDDDEVESLPLEEYTVSSPRPAADMLADVERLCDSVLTHKPWKKFMHSVLSDKRIRSLLLKAPAAKSVHHAYAGGLLEHMLSVAEICMLMADHYPDLDRQTLLAAALLHDIGKIDEMGGLLVTEYTDEGRLLGHIVQGIVMLEPHLRKSGLEPGLIMHFKHLIASHHGELQFGAVREPSTPEAFVLHHADNIDAKLAQCRGVLPPSEGGDGMVWSAYQSLLGRSVCRPVHTPEDPAAGKSSRASRQEKKEARQEERQCSLL